MMPSDRILPAVSRVSLRGAVSVATFARRTGLSPRYVLRLCRRGRIDGARLHPLTRQWWIYPPARLRFSPDRV